MNIDFNNDEIMLVSEILKESLAEIKEEGHKADDHTVAAELKRQETLVKGIISKLKAAA